MTKREIVDDLSERISRNRDLLSACEAALELLRDPDADAIAAARVEAMLDRVISKTKKGQA